MRLIKILILLILIIGSSNLVTATTNLICPTELQEVDKTGAIPIELQGYITQVYEIEVKCPTEIIVDPTFILSSSGGDKSIEYTITKPDQIYKCNFYLYLKSPRILQGSCVISMIWKEDSVIEPEPYVEPSTIKPIQEPTIIDRIFSWLRNIFS